MHTPKWLWLWFPYVMLLFPAVTWGQAGANDAYLRDSQGQVVRSSVSGDSHIGNLCLRTGYWTPKKALPECESDIDPPRLPAPTPPRPTPRPPPPSAPLTQYLKAVLTVEVFFDFGKSVIRPEGKAALDSLLEKRKRQIATLEAVIVAGYTDGVGNNTYNNSLSLRRAKAVMAYMVGNGVESQRTHIEGRGSKYPLADITSTEGRAKNRRVEITLVGLYREHAQ